MALNLYGRDTAVGTFVGPAAQDNDLTTGTATTGTLGGPNTQDTAFGTIKQGWEYVYNNDLSDGSNSWTAIVDVNAYSGSVTWRFRLARYNSSGTLQSSSAWSSTLTDASGTGEHTITPTWDAGTWATGDRLILEVDYFRTTGHGNVNMSFNVNSTADTRVVAPADIPPQVIAVGTLAETESQVAAGKSKTKAVGVLAETESQVAAAAAHQYPVPTLAETESITAYPPTTPGYMTLDGTGDYLRTADKPQLDITGDIEFIACVALDDWSPGATTAIGGKWGTGGDRSYLFQITAAGGMQINWFDGTTAQFMAGGAMGLTDGQTYWLRWVFDVSTGHVDYYYSSDPPNTDPDAVSWGTAYDSDDFGGATSINAGAAGLTLGSLDNPTGDLAGKVYGMWVRNGIDGVPLGHIVLDGTSDWLSAADAAPLDITGDVDMIACVAADDWTPTGDQWFVSKWEASNRSYGILLNAASTIQLAFSTDGTTGTFATSNTDLVTAIPSLVNGDPLWIRAYLDVNDGGGNYVVRYYYSQDDPDTHVQDVVWTALGTADTNTGTLTLFSGAAALKVGANNTGANLLAGKVYGAWVYSGIPATPGDPPSGTLVANPDYRVMDRPADDYDNTWTKNGNAVWRGQVAAADFRAEVTPDAGRTAGLTSADNWETLDKNALDVTGDLELIVCLAPRQWGKLGTSQEVINKWTTTGNQRSFRIYLNDNGQVGFRHSTTGTDDILAVVGGPLTEVLSDGKPAWLRFRLDVDNGSSQHTKTVDYSLDPPETPVGSVSWTTHQVETVAGTTSIFASTGKLSVADVPAFAGGIDAKWYYACMRNGFGGTTVGELDLRSAQDAEHLQFPGTGDYISTTDKAGFDFTGDCEFIFYASLFVDGSNYSPVITQGDPFSAGGGFVLVANPAGDLRWQSRNSGDTAPNGVSESTACVLDRKARWYRVRVDVGTTVSFWYSDDPADTDPTAVSWTAAGTDATGASAANNSTAAVKIGSNDSGDPAIDQGIYVLYAYSDLGTTLVMDPDWRTADVTTDGQSNTWSKAGNTRWGDWADNTGGNSWQRTGSSPAAWYDWIDSELNGWQVLGNTVWVAPGTGDNFKKKSYPIGILAESEVAVTITPQLGGGQVIAVATVAETDAQIGVSSLKAYAVATLTETDAQVGVAKSKDYPVGVLAETDSPVAVSTLKVLAVQVLAETESQIPVGVAETYAVATLAEVEAQIPVGRSKLQTVGTLLETDATVGISKLKVQTVGVLAETETPIAIDVAFGFAVPVLAETELQVAVGKAKQHTVPTLTETELQVAVDASLGYPVPTLVEVEAAVGISRLKQYTVGVLAETDAQVAVSVAKLYGVGTVAEVEAQVGISSAKTVTIPVLAETDSQVAVTVVGQIIVAVNALLEVEAQLAVSKSKLYGIPTLGEVDAQLPVGLAHAYALPTLTETESALSISKLKTLGVPTLAETAVNVPVSVGRGFSVETLSELENTILVASMASYLVATLNEIETQLFIQAIKVGVGWWTPIPVGFAGNRVEFTASGVAFTPRTKDQP